MTTLDKGTYNFRLDNAPEAPVTGGITYTVIKTHTVGDTRCSITASPMNTASSDIYTAFVGQNATGIIWQNLGKYLSTTRVDFKGLQDSETVNSGSITVTKAGLYLVKFELAHCGANNITNVGAYWNVDLRNSSDAVVSQYFSARNTIAIPLAKVWDYEVGAIGIYSLNAGTYYAKFQNKSGIATDSGYNSAVSIFAKYLGN